jgi:hypothetical protein
MAILQLVADECNRPLANAHGVLHAQYEAERCFCELCADAFDYITDEEIDAMLDRQAADMAYTLGKAVAQ